MQITLSLSILTNYFLCWLELSICTKIKNSWRGRGILRVKLHWNPFNWNNNLILNYNIDLHQKIPFHLSNRIIFCLTMGSLIALNFQQAVITLTFARGSAISIPSLNVIFIICHELTCLPIRVQGELQLTTRKVILQLCWMLANMRTTNPLLLCLQK